jgi:hypothetical protein
LNTREDADVGKKNADEHVKTDRIFKPFKTLSSEFIQIYVFCLVEDGSLSPLQRQSLNGAHGRKSVLRLRYIPNHKPSVLEKMQSLWK